MNKIFCLLCFSMAKLFDLRPIYCWFWLCSYALRRCAATQNNTDVEKHRSLIQPWSYIVLCCHLFTILSSEAHTAVFVSASLPVWIERLRINRAGFHQAAVELNVTQILVLFPSPSSHVSKPYLHLCNGCLSGDLDKSKLIRVRVVLNVNCFTVSCLLLFKYI